MGNQPSIRLNLIGALFLLSAPALAQQPQDNVLNPVVATASCLEQPLTETIAHTAVITWNEIRESRAAGHEVGVRAYQSSGTTVFDNAFDTHYMATRGLGIAGRGLFVSVGWDR